MAPFGYTLRVRFNECDPQGIAFNANYFTYIDIAITDLYRQHFDGSFLAVMESNGVDVVVAEANLKFLAPARFDQEIEVADYGRAARQYVDGSLIADLSRRRGARHC